MKPEQLARNFGMLEHTRLQDEHCDQYKTAIIMDTVNCIVFLPFFGVLDPAWYFQHADDLLYSLF